MPDTPGSLPAGAIEGRVAIAFRTRFHEEADGIAPVPGTEGAAPAAGRPAHGDQRTRPDPGPRHAREPALFSGRPRTTLARQPRHPERSPDGRRVRSGRRVLRIRS